MIEPDVQFETNKLVLVVEINVGNLVGAIDEMDFYFHSCMSFSIAPADVRPVPTIIRHNHQPAHHSPSEKKVENVVTIFRAKQKARKPGLLRLPHILR